MPFDSTERNQAVEWIKANSIDPDTLVTSDDGLTIDGDTIMATAWRLTDDGFPETYPASFTMTHAPDEFGL